MSEYHEEHKKKLEAKSDELRTELLINGWQRRSFNGHEVWQHHDYSYRSLLVGIRSGSASLLTPELQTVPHSDMNNVRELRLRLGYGHTLWLDGEAYRSLCCEDVEGGACTKCDWEYSKHSRQALTGEEK